MTVSFLDRCIFLASGTGLGDFVVALGVQGYMTPTQANVVNGATYHYIAQTFDSAGRPLQWEIGTGTFNTGTGTLARTTIIFSSALNTKVSFSSVPQVMITYLAEDVVTGPPSSAANHAATFGDATGKNLIDSKVTITPPATGSTLTIADGKTLTVSNTLTATGTDGSSVAFGTGGTVLYSGGSINPLILPKTTPAGIAPGAGLCLIQAVAGTDPGTCKIIIYAGTSNTPVTIVDSVGTGF
jgi:hypothetical protein